MEHVADLNRWAEAHPDIPAVVTHGIIPAALLHDIGIPEEVMTVLKRPNVYTEVMFHSKWPEYPFAGAQEMLKRLCGEVSVEKLMWGSDMPFTWYWCTYRQSMDYIRLHCDFLSEEEKGLILGGNVARLFKLR